MYSKLSQSFPERICQVLRSNLPCNKITVIITVIKNKITVIKLLSILLEIVKILIIFLWLTLL